METDSPIQSLNLKTRYFSDKLPHDNQFGFKGISRLARAISTNQTLRELNLERNKLTSESIIVLLKALTINQTLVKINLGKSDFTPSVSEALATTLEKNRTLQSLIIWGCKIDATCLGPFKEALCTNPTLVELDLSHNRGFGETAGPLVAEILRRNTALLELDLRDNDPFLFIVEIWEALIENSTLRVVYLSSNKIDDEGVIPIANMLEQNRGLQELHLDGNDIGDKGAVVLANSFKKNTHLLTLNLKNNKITERGAIALAHSLEVNKTLKKLCLNGNYLGDAGAKAFAEILTNNSTLTTANLTNSGLSFNYLTHGGISIDCLPYVVQILKSNSTLQSLTIEKSDKEDRERDRDESILLALKSNYTLTKLKVNGFLVYNIPNDIEIEIELLLDRNKDLQKKALQLAQDGSKELFDLLDQGVSIYSLDDDGNSFLHLAARYGHIDFIQPLLARSLNPTFPQWRNKRRKTALELAQESGYTPIIELLTQ